MCSLPWLKIKISLLCYNGASYWGTVEHKKPSCVGTSFKGHMDGARSSALSISGRKRDCMTDRLRVTVWNEYRHERNDTHVAEVYPEGIHNALAKPLREAGLYVRTAT